MYRLLPKTLSDIKLVNINTKNPVNVSSTIILLKARLINSIGDFFMKYLSLKVGEFKKFENYVFIDDSLITFFLKTYFVNTCYF